MDKLYDFQTLNEFITNPFGNAKYDKQNKLELEFKKIQKFMVIKGYCQVDDDYMIHIKIPSTSKQGEMYDVVILFFTDITSVKRELTVKNYYIKFFSNSPSFIYQYAALYNKHGFLIDMLYEKLDKNYINTLPDKTNSKYDMYYDKSIYCACRLLQENAFSNLNKMGIMFKHMLKPEKFLSNIKSFENVKFNNELKDLDKSINAELEKKKVEKKSSRVSNKKMPVTSTSKSGKSITVVKASSKVARKTRGGKKTASKTTRVK